ncbi:MAG: hypothetical protein FWC64_10810 [Treponema sp.]|nr:hypothetical protein [Treponema sp.]
MKHIRKLPDITTELTTQVQNLQCLAAKLAGLIGEFAENCQGSNTLPRELPPALPSNIIPFPSRAGPVFKKAVHPHRGCLLAAPGKPVPGGLTDYRPLLQRDGLILLSWDKRITEMGERYTAYWVTSAGVPRFYASKSLPPEDFPYARPDHKSYAAEDGIEFFGQDAPVYVAHVARELMMDNPRHDELRPIHIQMLKKQGSAVDFTYKYLLKTEKGKNRDALRKRANLAPRRA